MPRKLAGRSQSALSAQVRKLEGQLGVSLLHRTARVVGLTREGEARLPHARRAIAELEAGLRQVRTAAGIQDGHLALGCPLHVATMTLPPMFAELHAAHSGVALSIREMPQAGVLGDMRQQVTA